MTEEEQPRVRECIDHAEHVGARTVLWHGNLWPVTIQLLEAEGWTVTPCDGNVHIISWEKNDADR